MLVLAGERDLYLAEVQMARVVAQETNDEGKAVVIWVTHGTNLLRCGPHQVRPLVEDSGCRPVADPNAALEALKDLRDRSTTQFRDVHEAEPQVHDLLDPLDDIDFDGYSPSVAPEDSMPPDAHHDSDADSERELPVPGAVLLYQQAADSQQRRRRISTSSLPEPAPGVSADPPARPVDKRPHITPPASAQAAASSSAVASSPRVDGDAIPVDPVDVPLPMEEDDDLCIDDIFVIDVGSTDLPEGWIVVDGEFSMDEVWLAAKEANEKDMNPDQRAQMMEAKRKELTSYFDNMVWEFASADQADKRRTVTARWVLTWKPSEDGGPPRAKARLVLRSFQDPDVLDLQTVSPTATRQSKLILLALILVFGCEMWCGDVKAAFLSGAKFDRRILVRLPKDCGALLGISGDTVMRWLKSAYGLSDAPLLWYREADRRLTSANWKRHQLDRCLYMFFAGDLTLILVLLLHVDDVLLGGDRDHPEAKEALTKLRGMLAFGKWKTLSKEGFLVYCGGKIELKDGNLIVSYADYIRKVTPRHFSMARASPKFGV